MKKILSLLLSAFLAFAPLSFAASDGTYFDTDAKLMLHMDGTDGSTTFTDSSSSPKTVNANGNAQIDTAQKKFGSASGLFDGAGDSLDIADSSDWDFGTGDFTIDGWVRMSVTDNVTNNFISTYSDSGGTFGYYLRWFDNGSYHTFQFVAYDDAGSIIANLYAFPTSALAVNEWHHVAVVRNGTSFNLYVDGTSIANATSSSAVNGAASQLSVGALYSAGSPTTFMNGMMDEWRIVKGTAIWTSNFTPPSAAYQPASAIKTFNGLARSSAKTIKGVARASVKNWNGLA